MKMCVRITLLAVMLCGSAGATLVPITNASFENPALGETSYVSDIAEVLSDYGWTEDTPGRTWMIYNPKTYGTWDPIQPTDGLNWMQLTRAGQTMQISQITTGYTIEADKIYRVQFDVAQRSTWSSDTFVYSTLYSAKNGAQNRTSSYTLHQTGLNYFTNDNNWSTITYEWDSTGSPFVGQNFDLAIGGKAIIDNVRIEIIPEPATFTLLGLGAAFSLLRRKK